MAANPSATPGTAETLVHAPADLVADVGEKSRSLLQEVGSMFWFIINTIGETFDRMRRGRVPFRAASFFLYTERAGVGSVPLVAMVSFFLGLTMALLTGYQLERFGTERLVPGLVAIAFTRELGPLLTGIMLAARIGASFTAELGTMQVSEEVEAIEAMGIGPLRFSGGSADAGALCLNALSDRRLESSRRSSRPRSFRAPISISPSFISRTSCCTAC